MNQFEKLQIQALRAQMARMATQGEIELETAKLRHETAKIENEVQRVMLAHIKRLAETDKLPKLPITSRN